MAVVAEKPFWVRRVDMYGASLQTPDTTALNLSCGLHRREGHQRIFDGSQIGDIPLPRFLHPIEWCNIETGSPE